MTLALSKTFMAIGLLQLAERGELALDAPVADYLPEFPYRDITVSHLLSHTSGLPSYNANFDFEASPVCRPSAPGFCWMRRS